MNAFFKRYFPVVLFFLYCGAIHAARGNMIVSGSQSMVKELQEIGVAIAGLSGVVGGIMLLYTPEGGTRWISYCLLGAAAVGVVPSLVDLVHSTFT